MTSFPRPNERPNDGPPQLGKVWAHVAAAGLAQDDAEQRLPASGREGRDRARRRPQRGTRR